MSRKDTIEQKLADALELTHLEVLDESSNHSVPEGAQSHFKVIAVAPSFAEQSRIARHRLINDLLQAEFADGMHALAVHAYAPQEWTARFGNAPLSPPCSKVESSKVESSKVESSKVESSKVEKAKVEKS